MSLARLGVDVRLFGEREDCARIHYFNARAYCICAYMNDLFLEKRVKQHIITIIRRGVVDTSITVLCPKSGLGVAAGSKEAAGAVPST